MLSYEKSVINYAIKRTFLMMVGPDVAEEMLKRNTNNRNARAYYVALLADDMRRGFWQETHEGIAFDENGVLLDGQHRLLAIVQSGATVPLMVTTGLSPNALVQINRGRIRTPVDIQNLSGRGEFLRGGGCENSNMGMWRCMVGGLTSGAKANISIARMFDFQDRHRDAGMFSLEVFGRFPKSKKIHVAPVMSAVARSYYMFKHELDRVERFVEILCTSFSAHPGTPDENALTLRKWLIEDKTRRNSNASGEVYGKTAAALIAYMQDRPVSRLYCPSSEPFPLPDAVSADAGRADRMALDLGREGARGSAAH
jgi:hypothetical protein